MSYSPLHKGGLETVEFEDRFYQGYCYKGLSNGRGVAVYKNGDCYYGEFKDNFIRGKGYFFPAMGGVVEGHFENDFANRFCTLVFPNGDRYQGFFKEGQMHGKGIYYSASSNSWTYNQYECGDSVHEIHRDEGELLNIETDGLMISNLKSEESGDNETYEGELKDGVKQRLGILSLEDRTKKLGVWRNNLLDGLGVEYSSLSGLTSVGKFKEGNLHGFGRRTESNGQIYVGYFECGEYNGEGVLIDSRSKEVTKGVFKQGKIVSQVTGDRDLNLEFQRGVSSALRKRFQESLSAYSKLPESSPDFVEFLHQVEEKVHSKILSTHHSRQKQGSISNVDGNEELQNAKKIKERIDDDTQRIETMSPVSQSKELIKIAQELLSEIKDPAAPFRFSEQSKFVNKEQKNPHPSLLGGKNPSDSGENQPKSQFFDIKRIDSAPETLKTTVATKKDSKILSFDQLGSINLVNSENNKTLPPNKARNRMRNISKHQNLIGNNISVEDQAEKELNKIESRMKDTQGQNIELKRRNDENILENSSNVRNRNDSKSSSKHAYQQNDDLSLSSERSKPEVASEGIDSFGSLEQKIEEKVSYIKSDLNPKKGIFENQTDIHLNHQRGHLEQNVQHIKLKADFQNSSSDDESLTETLNAMENRQPLNGSKKGLESAKSAERLDVNQEIEEPKSLSLLITPTKIQEKQLASYVSRRLTPIKKKKLITPSVSRENIVITEGLDIPEFVNELTKITPLEGKNLNEPVQNQNNAQNELNQLRIPDFNNLHSKENADVSQVKLVEEDPENADVKPTVKSNEFQKSQVEAQSGVCIPKIQSSITFKDPVSRYFETDNSETKFNRDGILKPFSTAENTIPTKGNFNSAKTLDRKISKFNLESHHFEEKASNRVDNNKPKLIYIASDRK